VGVLVLTGEIWSSSRIDSGGVSKRSARERFEEERGTVSLSTVGGAKVCDIGLEWTVIVRMVGE
jgi:hypothetical protein